jgi:cytoskeleton-associated protein 5
MDGPPPPEEDFTSIPIAERLSHKNWKARVNGYESLIKTFENTASDTDPAFKPYINNLDILKKFATDSNAVAQEKGVELPLLSLPGRPLLKHETESSLLLLTSA